MTHFVPRDKLSKKARRKLDSQQRRTWTISPGTITMESKKTYKRHRKSHDYQDEWNRGIIFFIYAAVPVVRHS